MGKHTRDDLVTLGEDWPVWEQIFTVNPLVVLGTREGGGYDLAPKHMAFPMGWENYFGFVCTPRHATYHNARREAVYTVSYPKPTQVVLTSLAAPPSQKSVCSILHGSLGRSACGSLCPGLCVEVNTTYL